MIGRSQGETEIPLDPAEGVLRASENSCVRVVFDPLLRPTHKQRGQTSILRTKAGHHSVLLSSVQTSSWTGFD
jgi:hypothetical protein